MENIKIGDRVRIINNGYTYEYYETIFNELCFNNTDRNESVVNNSKGVVFGIKQGERRSVLDNSIVSYHVVAINIDNSDKQVLINIKGVEKVDSYENVLYEFMNSWNKAAEVYNKVALNRDNTEKECCSIIVEAVIKNMDKAIFSPEFKSELLKSQAEFNEMYEKVKSGIASDIERKFNLSDKVIIKGEQPKKIWEIEGYKHCSKGKKDEGEHIRYRVKCKHEFQWVRECKLELYKEKPEPKFKKGNWIRYKNDVRQINIVKYNYRAKCFQYSVDTNHPFNYTYGIMEADLEPYKPKDGECYITEYTTGIGMSEFLNCKKENMCYFISKSGSIYLSQNDIEDGEIILRPATKEEEIKIRKAIADQKGEAFVNGKWEKLW